VYFSLILTLTIYRLNQSLPSRGECPQCFFADVNSATTTQSSIHRALHAILAERVILNIRSAAGSDVQVLGSRQNRSISHSLSDMYCTHPSKPSNYSTTSKGHLAKPSKHSNSFSMSSDDVFWNQCLNYFSRKKPHGIWRTYFFILYVVIYTFF
jgi:hypothetical protein